MNFGENRGRAPELLALLDAALAEGADITLDSYPYTPGCTTLVALLPSWANEGGPEAGPGPTAGRRPGRADPPRAGGRGRRRLSRRPGRLVDDRDLGHRGPRPRRVRRQAPGRLGDRPPAPAGGPARADDPPARRGRGERPGDHAPPRPHRWLRRHPPGRETAPARLRHLPPLPRPLRPRTRPALPGGVRGPSGRPPAARLRLPDRGLVRVGYRADLVLFAPDTVAAGSTYERPRVLPTGVPHVLIDGRFVMRDGRRTDVLAGRSVRRTARDLR